MGWTGVSIREVGRTAEEIRAYLKNDMESGGYLKVLDISKKGNVVYMAVQNVEKKHIFATVTLISISDGEFMWKDMDETVGPCEDDCPKKILDQLSPTTSEYALEWRKRCRAKLALGKVKYHHGDVLEFPNEISFSNGFKGKTFILYKEGRKTMFLPYNGETDMSKLSFRSYYSITRWKQYEPVVKRNLSNPEVLV